MKGTGILVIGILCLSHYVSPAIAAQESESASTTQNVGGLLFDVDEGVKVEQGPGGSVYVKSNREYMQAKFESIEERLTLLETRVRELEFPQKKKVDLAAAEEAKVLVTT